MSSYTPHHPPHSHHWGHDAQDYELLAGSRGLSEGAMCGALRHSVTAVVYFLSPHRVKYADIIIMCALSKLVRLLESDWVPRSSLHLAFYARIIFLPMAARPVCPS